MYSSLFALYFRLSFVPHHFLGSSPQHFGSTLPGCPYIVGNLAGGALGKRPVARSNLLRGILLAVAVRT